MKWLFVLIFLGFFSCSRNIVITEEDIKPDVFYFENESKPFTGAAKILYRDSDVVKVVFHFREGRLNGDFEYFYPDGSTRWNGKYQDGHFTGQWQEWDDSGNLILVANYNNDSLISCQNFQSNSTNP